jgi:hypothetical protein
MPGKESYLQAFKCPGDDGSAGLAKRGVEVVF